MSFRKSETLEFKFGETDFELKLSSLEKKFVYLLNRHNIKN